MTIILYLILSTALKSGYSSSTEQKDAKEKDCLMSNINKPEGNFFAEISKNIWTSQSVPERVQKKSRKSLE